MELLLNLTWLAVSVILGTLLIVSRSKRDAASGSWTYSRSTAWIAYAVLIALLLPAISMTDDLMAMATPSDGEQVVRRYESLTACQLHPGTPCAIFHVVRDHFPSPLACIERMRLVPDLTIPTIPLTRYTRDRAPPATA